MPVLLLFRLLAELSSCGLSTRMSFDARIISLKHMSRSIRYVVLVVRIRFDLPSVPPPPVNFLYTQAELETKELRDAARLEASRRAKQEAEARFREQKAQRQAEVEKRREQERADKEARDARERQEKEARRLAAVAEAKAKATQEVRWYTVPCWLVDG